MLILDLFTMKVYHNLKDYLGKREMPVLNSFENIVDHYLKELKNTKWNVVENIVEMEHLLNMSKLPSMFSRNVCYRGLKKCTYEVKG